MESTRKKGNKSKRDRITFRLDNVAGMQMATEKQQKTKQAGKVLGFEAFE